MKAAGTLKEEKTCSYILLKEREQQFKNSSLGMEILESTQVYKSA